MAIDQQLRIALFKACAGKPSMTVGDLVILLDGGSLAIDQSLRVALYRTLGGFPGATVEDIVALSSGGGLPETTTSLIESIDVANWWPLNQESGDLFGNHGRRPVAGVPFAVAPNSADSIPMASEPDNTATFFDGTAQCIEINNAVDIPYTTATVVMFFKAPSFAAGQVLFSHGNSVGTFSTRLQINAPDLFLAIIGLETSDRYTCSLTLPANIVVDRWHMFAWRQAVNGIGLDFFFDGSFFANASSEVANAFDGAGTVDFSFNNANTAGANRLAIGMRANAGLKLTGSMFHVIIDDKVWTTGQLIGLWDQALASGLNA